MFSGIKTTAVFADADVWLIRVESPLHERTDGRHPERRRCTRDRADRGGSRASIRQIRLPAPDSARAAASPAAPAPMMTTSYCTRHEWCVERAGLGFSDDLAPGQLPHELHFLVDRFLRGSVAEHTPEVFDLGGNELVVLGEESEGGGLEVTFGDGDELGGLLELRLHDGGNAGSARNHPAISQQRHTGGGWRYDFRGFVVARVGSTVLKPNESCTNVCLCGRQPQRAQRIPSTCAARE